jgi:hypothetical protein
MVPCIVNIFQYTLSCKVMLQGNNPCVVIDVTVDVILRENCDTQGCQHTWAKRHSYCTLYNSTATFTTLTLTLLMWSIW